MLLAIAAAASPRPVAAGPQASLPFVSHSGIRDWRAVDDPLLMLWTALHP